MAQPTAQEQYLLELTNRFRLNPAAEYNLLVNAGEPEIDSAINFFKVDLSVLQTQWNQLTAAPALAWSSQLNESALAHNQLMIVHDQQSHNLPNEPDLLNRINNAGNNNYTSVAENIFAYTSSPLHTHAGLAIDWGDDDNDPNNGYGTGIQNPAGHRISLLNAGYREIGLAITAENNPETQVGPFLATQHFGSQSSVSDAWLLGVAYRDFNDDDFYSVGEGLGDVTVNISDGNFSTAVQTQAAGGYQTLLPQGTYTVSFMRNGTTLKTYNNIVVGGDNVKQDLLVLVGTRPAAGLGKIVGTQFDDANGNGVQDDQESGISNRTMFIDANQNNQLDTGEVSTTTDAEGLYIFNNINPGNYRVLSVIPPNRAQTAPNPNLPLGVETYQTDDGSANSLEGFGSDVLIFNQFEAIANQETLTSISVGLNTLSNPSKLFIYQDANNDNKPDASEKLLAITPTLSGTRGFANVAIAPTTVSGTFFIAALHPQNYNQGESTFAVAPADTDAIANKSWIAFSGDSNSFIAEAYTEGNWLLRANAEGPISRAVTVVANQTVSGVDFGDRSTVNTLTGTPNDDLLFGGNNKDLINGAAGNDSLYGSNGDDTINGNDGDDFLLGEGDNDILNGGNGSDILVGGSGNDTLNGEGGDDLIYGEDNDDTLNGGAGLDSLFGDAGNDNLSGGDGNDMLQGGTGNDTLNGDAGNDNLSGEAGNDEIFGGLGTDKLTGGTGTDTLNGGSGDDYLYGQLDDDTLNGDAGKDLLIGGAGNDQLNGGDSSDTLYGGTGNDTMRGGDDDDILFGESGDDTMYGGSGRDMLQGGAGSDNLSGDAGDDSLSGDAGNDTLFGGLGNDLLNGGRDNDSLFGGAGNDGLNGGDGSDMLTGDSGDDYLIGNAGDDTLIGGEGNDYLIGNAGNDRLIGGELNNSQSRQIDTLTGSEGADTFVVHSMYSAAGDSDYAVVRDFNTTEDFIELGSGSYRLADVGGSLPGGVGIYNNNDLIAIVKGQTTRTIALGNSYFSRG